MLGAALEAGKTLYQGHKMMLLDGGTDCVGGPSLGACFPRK